MKTKLLFIILATLLSIGGVAAQNNVEAVLQSIETNNTTLKALKEEVEAEKLMNKTGLTLPDPEVEFAYLWGQPGDIGNRKDFSVTQSFDMPTLLGLKKRVAEKENGVLDLQYKQQKMMIMQESRKLLVELTYTNARLKTLEKRMADALILAEAYQTRLKSGDANIIEVNKTELNRSNIANELRSVEIERIDLLNQLQRLNGGNLLEFTDTDYANAFVGNNFEEWYAEVRMNNPVLQVIQGEIETDREKVKLNKAMGLPSFSAGYMSEVIPGQSYRGVSVGMSIPLWSNKNRVKQAKAALKATELKMEDAKLQFYQSLQSLYNKTTGLQQAAQTYRENLTKLNNEVLLAKALKAGQISLLEYMMETALYYDAADNALRAERDFRLAAAELASVAQN